MFFSVWWWSNGKLEERCHGIFFYLEGSGGAATCENPREPKFRCQSSRRLCGDRQDDQDGGDHDLDHSCGGDLWSWWSRSSCFHLVLTCLDIAGKIDCSVQSEIEARLLCSEATSYLRGSSWSWCCWWWRFCWTLCFGENIKWQGPSWR